MPAGARPPLVGLRGGLASYSRVVSKRALLFPVFAVAFLALAACSQSSAHPPSLPDCTLPYGCNPGQGLGTSEPGDGSGGDGGLIGTARDASRDGADSGG